VCAAVLLVAAAVGVDQPLSKQAVGADRPLSKQIVPTGSPISRKLPSVFWAALSGHMLAAVSSMFVGCALVDHGHTQHNSIAILCTILWALLITRSFKPRAGCLDLVAAAVFVAALNFKQMALYFALPVFVAHLLLCTQQPGVLQKLGRLICTGMVVLGTQAAILLPLCQGPVDCWAQGMQVLSRVFPTTRGIYEDKVANLWCVMEPFFKSQQRLLAGTLSATSVLAVSVLGTLVLCAPALALVWTRLHAVHSTERAPLLLTVCALCALAFFLCSVQVHEKTILFPLSVMEAAQCLTARCNEKQHLQVATSWFRLHALLSLVPLLRRDGVLLALSVLFALLLAEHLLARRWHQPRRAHTLVHGGILAGQILMVGAEVLAVAPVQLPHLFLLGLAAMSFSAFMLTWYEVTVASFSTYIDKAVQY